MSSETSRAIGEDRLHGKGDDLYEALLLAHEGLDDAESRRLNARLVLMLANELGDVDRAIAIFRKARQTMEG